MLSPRSAWFAVVIGQRASALTGAGEVIVSSTVKDLVAGSGITFKDSGPSINAGRRVVRRSERITG